ncbi:ATP phosphoribosyltransferase regulatory subunit [Helicobacter apodemus]|uniref:ATP phosphoribosyltransferase regulatory subunit n=1 Tax=Helicobacter apodemus TaxID=135569 RepID=A0A4U8UGP9_9HELI|nr:ATP phosphoribosyltransferase regulatory subunit [Helicobacter apodemus]TLE15592.1 ATP phosphoribosyltransferase regulatory subunit [Helicobacter apodemus]
MILSHEIPQGSKLYFGKSARAKRNLENLVSKILYENGYEEIVTPTFAYLQHQRDIQNREVVRTNNQYNQQIVLRNDSTIDAIRLLAPHLKEQNIGRKWFYIQPIFTYPTTEFYQIGVENLENCDITSFIQMSLEILNQVQIQPFLQITNVKIPQICSQIFNIPFVAFEKIDISVIENAHPFMARLLEVQDLASIEGIFKNITNFSLPKVLEQELKILLEVARNLQEQKPIISPLYCPAIPYYNGMLFRFFLDNQNIILGGDYEILGQRACGFGIYTDHIMLHLN